MAHGSAHGINVMEDDGFDQQQLELAIAQSLARTDLQHNQVQPKPSWYEDDDLQRALAESMRTFEEEQQGGGGHMVGHKRSSSPETAGMQHQFQGPPPTGQQPAPSGGAGGALKRQRSISLPGDGVCAVVEAAGQPLEQASKHHGVLRQPAVEQQQAPVGMRGVQRSISATNATAEQGWAPDSEQQQQLCGLGRSASAQDLTGAFANEGGAGGVCTGSRPTSPTAHRTKQHALADEDLSHLLVHAGTDDVDEGMMHSGSSSMSSIAHDSGLPHTMGTWGPALLQVAAAAAANQGVQRIVGVGPAPQDPGDWVLHSRQLYPGQHVYWQQYRSGLSYSGRILSIDGDGSTGHPTLYTAEIFGHATLTYVEATAEQLHPQLRRGDRVRCKPAVAKRAQWSGYGPLYQVLHPTNMAQWLRPQQRAEDAHWVSGMVEQCKLHNGANPVAEVVLGTGEDRCWFIVSQLDLINELGESSLTAEARRAACVARSSPAAAGPPLVQPQAAAGAPAPEDSKQPRQPCNSAEGQQQQRDVEEVTSQPGHQQQQVLLPAEQAVRVQQAMCCEVPAGTACQQQAVPAVTQQQAACPAGVMAAPQQPCAMVVAKDAGMILDSATVSAPHPPSSAAPAAADLVDQGYQTMATAAPSGLSRPAGALTGESGLGAAATVVTVEQGAAAGVGGCEPGRAPSPAAPIAAGRGAAAADSQGCCLGLLLPAAALEGTGESAEGLLAEEVVGDSCALGEGAAEAAGSEGGGEGGGSSPKEPLSNQHSSVDDHTAAHLVQEGFGET